MSLDLPQIHATLSKPPAPLDIRGNIQPATNVEFESPFAALEKQLKIKISDDVLPLLGSEVSVSFPIPSESKAAASNPAPTAPAALPGSTVVIDEKIIKEPSTVIAISLRD